MLKQTGNINNTPNLSSGFFSLSYRQQRKLMIFLFSIVPIGLLITFTYYPFFNMVVYSFHSWNGISPTMDWVGLDNYIRIFTRPQYFEVFFVSLYYFAATFVQMAIALYFATVLTFPTKLKNFFKGTLFFPFLLNGVAVGFMFLFFYRPDGTLDAILSFVGLGNYTQLWLGNPNLINISLAGTSVWRYMGFMFIIFLGAMQAIPKETYEAAEIDGANRWHQFWYIIWPSLKLIIQLNIILAISGAIAVFEVPFIMTGGANGSATFLIRTIETAFEFRNVGLGSAMAIVLLVIVVSVTLIQRRFFGREA